jgi:ParB-like chromosome segregation protein Spo0J
MSDEKYVKTIEQLKAEVDRRSHPAAKVFPLLIDTDAKAWDQFFADVGKNGLRNPILIDRPVTEGDWLVLDGRNRYLACLMLGIEPEFEVEDVRDSAAVALVISANLLRRHDDVSVRAAQLAKLLEMLKVENFPTPTVPAAAAAAGISDRSLWGAGRLRRKDPKLADQVAKGNITMHAASQVADLPPEERDELMKEVAAAGNKKKAKGIVRARKRKKQQQGELGMLKMPGYTGAYSTLLAVLKNIPELPSELRNLRDDRRPLAVNHAHELRRHIEGLKMLDTEDLFVAADVAVRALDRIIARANVGAKEQPAEKPEDSADAVADVQREAS